MLAACSRNRSFALLLVLIAVVAGACLTPLAFARITLNTVDPAAALGTNGRQITVTGPLSTDQTQPVMMRVTVTQRSTGAIAEGRTVFVGTVEQQQWVVQAHAIGAKKFEPGPATVVALAQSRVIPGGADDAHQWLVEVTLTDE